MAYFQGLFREQAANESCIAIARNGDAHYGREWNLGVFKTLPTEAGDFRFGLRGAGYHADAYCSGTTKFWTSLQFRLAPRTIREIGGILSND